MEIGFIVLGLLAAAWRPSPTWIARYFINGYYPAWQHFWSLIATAFPFAIGDAVIALGVLAIVVSLIWVRPLRRALLGIAALAGFFAIWFYAGWGFGYDRAPIETRTNFDASRVNAAGIDMLRRRVITRMNALAPAAHSAANNGSLRYDLLRDAWDPVVRRLGNDWTAVVAPAKPALAGWFMNRTGTSGFTNPFTLESQLAPDLLWFERPFSQAHEWAHVAGFNREDEANYIAALTCLRDPDPIAQYSGALELFLYLPPLKKYPHAMFAPQVWSDFAAIRKRNAHFVNLKLSQLSWHMYNNYLQSNHIASGVQNYDEVTRLMAGIPLDPQGLPVSSPEVASTPRGNK